MNDERDDARRLRAYEALLLEIRRALIAWHGNPEGLAMDTVLRIDEAVGVLQTRLPDRPGHVLREWDEGPVGSGPVDGPDDRLAILVRELEKAREGERYWRRKFIELNGDAEG